MPPRDPTRPQIDFPQLVADLISDLEIRGTIGLLDFDPVMRPVYLAGTRDDISFIASPPVFTSAGIFNNHSTAPVDGAVLADTGQLPAGVYDIQAGMSVEDNDAVLQLRFEHRNAANTASLATVTCTPTTDINVQGQFPLVFALQVGLNERLRFNIAGAAATVASTFDTYIMVQRRTFP